VTNILYIHSVLDYEADRSVGKSTLAGLIPTPAGRLAGVFVFTFLPYILAVAGIFGGLMSNWYLLLLLTLPLGISLFRSMAAFTKDPSEAPARRKPWHGPMQKWEAIQKAELEWFMFRWYLARNLLTAFSLICMLAALLSGR
jgi:1,4-dihydroxy-2-naphthoate octaprenyltransferase